jgi:outer membrane protein OmpA-like peptidoglycan-associated protein
MRFNLVLVFCFFGLVVFAQQPADVLKLVNSVYDQQNPVLSPDGSVLYFTMCNHPQNTGGQRDPGDIWYSVLSGGQWQSPVHGGSRINSKGYNAVAGISVDGQQIFLFGHYDPRGGEPRTQGISVARKSGNEWSVPENITIPYFQNKSAFQSGYLSPDGSTFVFAAETYGSRAEDLYVTERGSDGKWSEPRSLGLTLNTQLQELSPYLSNDKKTLYYSTNARKGFGSFDVYETSRIDDSWTNWSEPVNLGPSINSEGRELFYIPYATLDLAMYTSTKNSDGYGDIRIFKSAELKKDSVIIAPVVVVTPQKEVKKGNTLSITGRVSNARTNESVLATIVFITSDTTVSATSSSAGYLADLKPSRAYTVKIEAPGYIGTVESFDASSVEVKSLELNFRLQPIEVGTTVTLKNVLFMQSKAVLLKESYPELDEVVLFMKANPTVEIELAGHTDNRGTPNQLATLSRQRVTTVKNYLVSKGIESKRITGKGYGGTKPVASNDTEETRALNRRVEFIIKKL